jgi:hypothetical protein
MLQPGVANCGVIHRVRMYAEPRKPGKRGNESASVSLPAIWNDVGWPLILGGAVTVSGWSLRRGGRKAIDTAEARITRTIKEEVSALGRKVDILEREVGAVRAEVHELRREVVTRADVRDAVRDGIDILAAGIGLRLRSPWPGEREPEPERERGRERPDPEAQ